MGTGSRVRVYVACSLDGFIAGPGDDLSWLPDADPQAGGGDEGAVGFEEFITGVGALLMGRRTYDVVMSFGVDWPYGDRPVLVPTHRPLETSNPLIRAVAGDIRELVAAAKEAAGGKDVYVDGGDVIRQAMDAGLVDDIIISVVPVVLGDGHPLFAGATRRHSLELIGHHRDACNLLQLHLRPRTDDG